MLTSLYLHQLDILAMALEAKTATIPQKNMLYSSIFGFP